MSYNKFDWPTAKKIRSARHYQLLLETYKLELTESEFIEKYSEKYPERPGLHRPKSLYHHLKDSFGFFTGEVS